jgi:hypothetical protein
MPVAVLRPFGPRGTVETPIARSHSMPSRARRTASSYHISGYLGQRDEPYRPCLLPPLEADLLTFSAFVEWRGLPIGQHDHAYPGYFGLHE